MNDITSTVEKIGRINFQGNIIPAAWYKHIRYASGKVNLNAIVILSEIVYWYRPVEVRDETTGKLLGFRKKFRGDKLQRSLQSFADQFGLTKRQVQDAIKFLRDKGLIKTELRTVTTSEGLKVGNALFIEPVPEMIQKITETFDDVSEDVPNTSECMSSCDAEAVHTSARTGSYDETYEVMSIDAVASSTARMTNTETNKETSKETNKETNTLLDDTIDSSIESALTIESNNTYAHSPSSDESHEQLSRATTNENNETSKKQSRTENITAGKKNEPFSYDIFTGFISNNQQSNGFGDMMRVTANGTAGHSTAESKTASEKKEEYTPEFEEFWQHYPRKVEKKRAFRMWKARLKEKVSPSDMIRACMNYAEYCRQNGTEMRYIKHPSTFLGPDKPYEEYINGFVSAAHSPFQNRTMPREPKSWGLLRELYMKYKQEEEAQGI